MRIALILLLSTVTWAAVLVLKAEAKAGDCYFDASTLTNKSGGSACSTKLYDTTRFFGCPCKIDMNVSLAPWACAGLRVSVNGTWIASPSPTWSVVYNLACNESHHSFAIVTCSTGCGGVNQSFIVAEYKGDCDQPCANGQGQFLQSGPPVDPEE